MTRKIKRVSSYSVSLVSKLIQKPKSGLPRFENDYSNKQRTNIQSFLVCSHCHMLILRAFHSSRICKNCLSWKLTLNLLLKKLVSALQKKKITYQSNEHIYRSSDLKFYFNFKDNSWGDMTGTSLTVRFSEKELNIIKHRKKVFGLIKDYTCGICLEFFKTKERYTWTSCKHLFHPLCLLYWVNINLSCPLCRFSLK